MMLRLQCSVIILRSHCNAEKEPMKFCNDSLDGLTLFEHSIVSNLLKLKFVCNMKTAPSLQVVLSAYSILYQK